MPQHRPLQPASAWVEVVATYRKTSSMWRANPDCIRKCYLYDAEYHLGGGAYLIRKRAEESAACTAGCAAATTGR